MHYLDVGRLVEHVEGSRQRRERALDQVRRGRYEGHRDCGSGCAYLVPNIDTDEPESEFGITPSLHSEAWKTRTVSIAGCGLCVVQASLSRPPYLIST